MFPGKKALQIANIKSKIVDIYMLEQLCNGNTFVHRLHPMVKLLTTVFFIIMVVSVNREDFRILTLYLFYPFVLMAVSETPYHYLLKQFALVLPLSALLGFSNIIFDTETALLIGPIELSYGVVSFFTIILKTYLTVMAALILVSTTSLQDLSNQMLRMRVPAIIIMLITMIYRYIDILLNETSIMLTAYLLRSPREKGIKISHMGSFVGQLLLRSIDRAERVYFAMKCRGYQGAVSYDSKRSLNIADYMYCVLVCSLALIFRFVDFVGLLGNMLI